MGNLCKLNGGRATFKSNRLIYGNGESDTRKLLPN